MKEYAMNKKEIISGWNPVKRLLSPVIAALPLLGRVIGKDGR